MSTVARYTMGESFLQCPDCGADAIPMDLFTQSMSEVKP